MEAYTPNQNKAEAMIRKLKRCYRRAMHKSHAPAILCDHCLQLMAEIRRHTTLNLLSLEGETPHTVHTGESPAISHLVEFEWYQLVWYMNPGQDGHRLGRWLGPSHSVGQAMCSKILTAKDKLIHHSSVWPVQANNNNDERNKECFGCRPSSEDKENDDEFANDKTTFVPYEDEASKQQKAIEIEDYRTDSFDKLISTRVSLPISGIQQKGCFIRRKRDHAGNPVGKYSSNPYHDTSLYDVEFYDDMMSLSLLT